MTCCFDQLTLLGLQVERVEEREGELKFIPCPGRVQFQGSPTTLYLRVMSGRMPITRVDEGTRMENKNAVHS